MELASFDGQIFQGHALLPDVLVARAYLCQLLFRHEGAKVRPLWLETCEFYAIVP